MLNGRKFESEMIPVKYKLTKLFFWWPEIFHKNYLTWKLKWLRKYYVIQRTWDTDDTEEWHTIYLCNSHVTNETFESFNQMLSSNNKEDIQFAIDIITK